jgi:hypothetical protein
LPDPREIAARLDGAATARSGHTLRHGLLLRNLTGRDLQIATNGHLTSVIVDPASGEMVGGFAGAQQQPLIIFRIAPGRTQRIPLLTGTASFTPRLGYAVPAGHWGIQATLTLEPDPRGSPPGKRTPVLPHTITVWPGLPAVRGWSRSAPSLLRRLGSGWRAQRPATQRPGLGGRLAVRG